MIPGLNPKKAAQLMKQMGIQQKDLDAVQVIIRLQDKELIFDSPQVAKVNMMGQETYQITGTTEVRETETEVEITQEDVQTVIDQTGASEEAARKSLEEHDGDIAEAILELKA